MPNQTPIFDLWTFLRQASEAYAARMGLREPDFTYDQFYNMCILSTALEINTGDYTTGAGGVFGGYNIYD